jgi:hypothetical protein
MHAYHAIRNKRDMKYRKLPVEIEAMQLHYSTYSQNQVLNWINADQPNGSHGPDGGLFITALEGDMFASTGDYIIKDIKGEFYPCKPEIFELTYEAV